MIQFNKVTKSFGAQVLFEDLSFALNRRERVGLVGRNGHGKTTIFRMVLDEVHPDSGDIIIPRRYRIGHLDQHIKFSKPNVIDEVSLGLPEAERDQTWRVETILFGLGFSKDDMTRAPGLFSGGFQVRLNLARVLVSEPDLLLLDEPTNYLDIVSIRWLERFLMQWKTELMLITHDRSFMDKVITHTVAIHRQKAKKIQGDTSKIYEQILQEEEVYEKTRANDERKRKDIERFIDRFRAKNTMATRVQSRIKMLAKHERLDALARIQTLDFAFSAAPFPAKVVQRVSHLSFGYEGGDDLFSNLNLEIHDHDRICVIGPNGRGKSTLLRVLAEELPPRHGTVTNHPRAVSGYFAQTNVHTLHDKNTVIAEIQSADKNCLYQTARNIAGVMMFEGDAGLKKIGVLSGGEKSRVMLGKLIVTPVNLLLLDEPTNHLDMDSCDSLLAAIDAFEGAVVIVTHNEMFLHSLATRFVVFDRGRARVFDGSYQDFLDTVGWESDEDELGAAPTKARVANVHVHVNPEPAPARKPAPPQNPADRKAERQARARLVQERARLIGPLEKRVADLEALIVSLERERDVAFAALAEASASGDAATIAKLSKKSSDVGPRIEWAYGELEKATNELESAARAFDERSG
ncbi:MAG TPA: ABC-F family ATP-binding cassette domain-containing protein [Candidatus Krumholzibacteria bacterium]|nr:ABC-F family ATP-binding cassette domain-containing protein [Candidatus Krumholzibacteria bacterium]